jgi:hypothetical protein
VSEADPRDLAAELLEGAALELEAGAAHCRVAAQHYREREIPRAAAHAWAAEGHMREAAERLANQSREHARRSRPDA